MPTLEVSPTATHWGFSLGWDIPWDFKRLPSNPQAADAVVGVRTVVVRRGDAGWPERDVLGAGPFRRADENGCVWLRVPGAATFAIRGLEVVVEDEPDGDPTLRDLALAGPVASLVIRNAGMVPVHGAAVREGEFAAVILGAAAVGVSTLAGALVVRGMQFVGDETLALIPRAGLLPLVAGGGSTLQLPPDTEAALRPRLGTSGVPLRPAQVLPRLDVPLDVDSDLPAVAAIYVLDAEATTEPKLAEISGLARMEAVQAADSQRALRREQGYDSDDFVAAATVTGGVAMRQVSRLDGPELHVGRLSRLVRGDFQAVCRTVQGVT